MKRQFMIFTNINVLEGEYYDLGIKRYIETQPDLFTMCVQTCDLRSITYWI